MNKKYRGRKWYAYAVAGCIAVAFYVLLTHFGAVTQGIATFIGYFKVVLMGCVLAYIMNPLAKMFYYKVFKWVKKEGLRWTISIAITVIIVILVIGFLLGTLIPQLMDSLMMLVNNSDMYLASLQGLLESWGLGDSIDLDKLMSSSGAIAQRVQAYINENANTVVNTTTAAGKGILSWVIAFILSVYMLAAKDRLKGGINHLLSTLVPKKYFNRMLKFFSRCDQILVSYIVSSLLDSLIVGVVNAVFMSLMGMQYVGLISVIVALTNLIPTFGPIIGGAIGAFILVLVKPWHALAFFVFTLVLQFVDGYIIKPKLFGSSLGVSGLLILISVLVCGNIAGVVGILLSIPLAAILNFVYVDVTLPYLEKRAAKREAAEAKSKAS
ncbi:MAG: AI-2E family transporter [Mogibacterium sp.]|nr:AI-2E family transporter [Mogibacterium sp.]